MALQSDSVSAALSAPRMGLTAAATRTATLDAQPDSSLRGETRDARLRSRRAGAARSRRHRWSGSCRPARPGRSRQDRALRRRGCQRPPGGSGRSSPSTLARDCVHGLGSLARGAPSGRMAASWSAWPSHTTVAAASSKNLSMLALNPHPGLPAPVRLAAHGRDDVFDGPAGGFVLRGCQRARFRRR